MKLGAGGEEPNDALRLCGGFSDEQSEEDEEEEEEDDSRMRLSFFIIFCPVSIFSPESQISDQLRGQCLRSFPWIFLDLIGRQVSEVTSSGVSVIICSLKTDRSGVHLNNKTLVCLLYYFIILILIILIILIISVSSIKSVDIKNIH
ncbi:hypothetical protein Baya_16495 [Bagarius yarrelli]|uniref:Uncharacterized protein n=1 Tax=Bagarius yarrelli TaxID=175774 RepID=A0A556VVJ6_BAGYA|nr:hypothetical protein Baya_16495 [Bagarius yarrelli]